MKRQNLKQNEYEKGSGDGREHNYVHLLCRPARLMIYIEVSALVFMLQALPANCVGQN